MCRNIRRCRFLLAPVTVPCGVSGGAKRMGAPVQQVTEKKKKIRASPAPRHQAGLVKKVLFFRIDIIIWNIWNYILILDKILK